MSDVRCKSLDSATDDKLDQLEVTGMPSWDDAIMAVPATSNWNVTHFLHSSVAMYTTHARSMAKLSVFLAF